MGPELSPVIAPAPFPRLLIAENNASTVESMVHTFADSRLDADYDLCPTYDHAVVKLFCSPPPYQLVISSIRLAEKDDFFLLRHNRCRQPFVPFIITTEPWEIQSSRRALEEGAFDFIPIPLECEQMVRTIRLALWHNKLKAIIDSRDKALERYRQHIANYPGDRTGEGFRTIRASIEQSISAYGRTIDRFETSIKCFADLAKYFESQAKERALERLDLLSK